MVVETHSAAPLDAVAVEVMPGGAASCVWLRKNIEQDAADNGPDEAMAIKFYKADEVCFMAEGAVSTEDIAAAFDGLWAAHEHDGMTDAERLAALEQAQADNMAALLEIGDILGGE